MYTKPSLLDFSRGSKLLCKEIDLRRIASSLSSVATKEYYTLGADWINRSYMYSYAPKSTTMLRKNKSWKLND